MTLQAQARPRPARTRPEPPIRLSRDGGRWIVCRTDRPQCAFADFDDALRNARQAPGSRTATIEVWHGGEYICCLPPQERPLRDGAVPELHAPRCPVVERHANRVAQFMLPVVGLFFWLALMVIALAASFGCRLALP